MNRSAFARFTNSQQRTSLHQKERLMRSKSANLFRLCTVVVLFFSIELVDASAQQNFSDTKSAEKPASELPVARPEASSTETERIRVLEQTLRQQNEKIDQMLKLIQRQQQMIDSIDARTSRDQSKNPAVNLATSAAAASEKTPAERAA